MKNLFNSLAIIVLLASSTINTNAQSPQMYKRAYATADNKGRVQIDETFGGVIFLSAHTNGSYTTPTGPRLQELLRTSGTVNNVGQSVLLDLHFLIRNNAGTLRVYTNSITAPDGNVTFAANPSGAGRYYTRSIRGIENDVTSFLIDTCASLPAIYQGDTNWRIVNFQMIIDSIPMSARDANGNFLSKISYRIETPAYPLGTAPYIAPVYSDGVYTMTFGPNLPYGAFKAPIKVDASFSTAMFQPGYLGAVSTHDAVHTGFEYFPTNYHDAINCDKLGANLYEQVGTSWVFKEDTMMSPFYHKVDQTNTGENRTDKVSFGISFLKLKDTTKYKVEFFNFKNNQKIVAGSYEIYTKKLYVEPSIENIVVSEVTHNSAKVTLTYYLGNTNTAALDISVLGASGSMFTRSFTTAGIPGTLVTEVFTVTGLVPNTAYAVHPKKGAELMKPIVPFTTLVEPIVITTIDPWSWTSDAVTGSTDGLSAVQTVKSILGNDNASVYVLVDPSGNPIEKVTLLDAATKTINIDGLVANTSYTFRLYYRATGKPDELKGSFSWKSAGGTVGIYNTTNTEFSVYPNPFINTLSVSKLERGTEMKLSDFMGRVISSTTEKTMSTESLPVGMYFLRVNDQIIKVEKR